VLEPFHLDEALAMGTRSVGPPPPMCSTFRPLDEEIRALERERIEQALAAAGGNQRKAAALLSMPLRTFATRLASLGLRQRDRA
jgi:DNA-binding NtrC family response regulator